MGRPFVIRTLLKPNGTTSVPPSPPIYLYKRAITIDKTKVSGINTNFPLLIKGTYAYLKTVANGGNVIDPNGYDINFFGDAALTILLKWEPVFYDPTTGELIYWVKVPSVTDGTNAVIYLGYGAATITTDQSDKVNVWDANYKMVQHLPDGVTLSADDSTANANNGAIGFGVAASAGKIYGAANFFGSENIALGNPASLVINGKITLSCWVNLNSLPGFIYTFIQKGGEEYRLRLFLDNLQFGSYDGSDHQATFVCTGVFNVGDWNKLDGVYDGANLKIFFNGDLKDTVADPVGAFAGAGNAYLGQADFGRNLDGLLEECRISDTDRSDGWILTEYNNQNSPSTFYSIGAVI